MIYTYFFLYCSNRRYLSSIIYQHIYKDCQINSGRLSVRQISLGLLSCWTSCRRLGRSPRKSYKHYRGCCRVSSAMLCERWVEPHHTPIRRIGVNWLNDNVKILLLNVRVLSIFQAFPYDYIMAKS